jgi:endonuclease III
LQPWRRKPRARHPRCRRFPVAAGRLILHGRYVCKARKPDCPHCAIRDLCLYRHKAIGDPETA